MRCSLTFAEVRFIIEDELTRCYVLVNALGDCPLGAQGWHYEVFPKSKSVLDIMTEWKDGKFDPVIWPLKAPEEDK
jgi:hypothetical protein